MNILITTAEWKSTLTCMRSLAKKGHEISLLSDDPYTPTLYSKFCKERNISPPEYCKEAYLEFLFSVIQRRKYDLLIPISDLCIEYFIEIQQELSKYVKILLSSKESIDIARNKDITYRFAYENNVPIPKTYFPKDIQEVEKIAEEITFPCVIKKTKGTGGSGNTYINERQSLISFFKSIKGNVEKLPLVQEFIKSRFYGLTAVCDQGKLLDFFMYEVLKQYPDTGGPTVYGCSIFDEDAFEASRDLISKLLWTGPIDLDFFITEDRRFILLEINPRFSGAIQFAYACGVDLPLKYLELILGKQCTNHQRRYETGVYYRSIFPEEIDSCISNKKYIFNFFINFLRTNTYYDFSFADPNLLIMQIKNTKWSISRHYQKYKEIKNLNNTNKGIALKVKMK